MKVYKVKDWSERFEKADSRRCVQMKWVAMPNSFDSLGFRKLVRHERKVEIYAAWNLIVLVASKMPNRGMLKDGDGPLDSEDLSLITGFEKEIFDLAIPVLVKLAWLEEA
jgi:hypothetical protein